MINHQNDPPLPTVEEVLELLGAKAVEISEKPDGRFCRGDLMRLLGLSEPEAHNLIGRWRRENLIEPAGKVRRMNDWGENRRVHAYKLSEDKKGE